MAPSDPAPPAARPGAGPHAAPDALTVRVVSFSYRAGGLPADDAGHGGGFVFDCRSLPNPHWEEALRPLHGDEPPVMAFLAAQPAVAAFVAHAAALVLQAARTYRADGRTRLMVACGCTGGRHRSVYVAARLAEALRAVGIAVRLEHRDRDRPPEPPPAEPPAAPPADAP
jgi:RNase adaptor protein for sRNA GlmZ degradation